MMNFEFRISNEELRIGSQPVPVRRLIRHSKFEIRNSKFI